MSTSVLRRLYHRARPVVATVAVIATAAAVALSATACGGSGESADKETTSPGTSGRIVFGGLVDYPMTFTVADMDYMDWVTVTAQDPQGASHEYEGVRLSDIFYYVGVRPEAKTVVITAADGATQEATLADIPPDALLVLSEDDAFGTVMPGLPSTAWVKDIVRMTFK